MQTAHVGLRVSYNPEEDALLIPGAEVNVRTLLRRHRQLPRVPEDIRAVRETDPRRAFGDLFASMLRRFT
jgi:hypothetical protein